MNSFDTIMSALLPENLLGAAGAGNNPTTTAAGAANPDLTSSTKPAVPAGQPAQPTPTQTPAANSRVQVPDLAKMVKDITEHPEFGDAVLKVLEQAAKTKALKDSNNQTQQAATTNGNA